jgi:hypothetical protein
MKVADYLHPILPINVQPESVSSDPEFNDATELQTGKQKEKCRCHHLQSTEPQKQPSPDFSTDWSVAFASASRRLRHIVFDNRVNRYKLLQYCDWWLPANSQISQNVRDNHM